MIDIKKKLLGTTGINLLVVLSAFIVFIVISTRLNRYEIWFSNMDMDSVALVGALEINSGEIPPICGHPAYGTYFVYGRFLKLFELFGFLPISDIKQFSNLDDPLLVLPKLFYKGRLISILLSIFCSVLFGMVFYVLTKNKYIFTIGTILFLFSGGVFFQSLVVRSELLSVILALVSLLLLALCYRAVRHPITILAMLFLSGMFFGFSLLTKIQILPFGVVISIALIYLAFYLKQQPMKMKHTTIIFIVEFVFLSVYSVFFYLIFKCNSLLVVSLYSLFLLFLGVVSFFSSVKRSNLVFLAYLIAHFGIGLLLSTVITYYLLNFASHPGSANEMVYFLTNADSFFKQDLNFSWSWVSGLARNYYSYYLLKSSVLITILILLLFVKNTNILKGSFFLLLSGLGFCFFNSLRSLRQPSGISEHYLIYSDVFFTATLTMLVSCWLFGGRKDMMVVLTTRLKHYICFVLITLTCVSQIYNIVLYYPSFNKMYRNRVDTVPTCLIQNQDYYELLLERYGTVFNIVERIFIDPRLNGAHEQIEIMNLRNIPVIRDCMYHYRTEQNIYKMFVEISAVIIWVEKGQPKKFKKTNTVQ